MNQQLAESNNNTALISSQDRLDRDASWRPILHASNQVVLYNPTSHALTIHRSSHSTTVKQSVPHLCPYCSQPLTPGRAERDGGIHPHEQESLFTNLNRFEDVSGPRASNYFQLLQVANDSASRPPTPPLQSAPSVPPSRSSTRPPSPTGIDGETIFTPETMAEGYFKAFFQEEARLGMGANGSVFLCQHVLNGNPLGRFAVKKIAVGQSASYLLSILREVHLLETLRHPNIITYHHAWLETAQFSSFGPRIPTLHVLMQWAEGGSLDDYIDARLGRPPHPASAHEDESPSDIHSRSARIRAFRAMQRAAPSEKSALRAKLNNNGDTWTAVHLLSPEEVLGIFGGVAAGLGFLHDKSILHLDLKPGNVLLTWDEGTLIPRAMLSDFGTSRDMMQTPRTRSGNTGTLEYSSPESLPVPPHNTLPPTDSKSDMWSLGMILHKLIFFRLPYRWAAYGDRPDLDDGKDCPAVDAASTSSLIPVLRGGPTTTSPPSSPTLSQLPSPPPAPSSRPAATQFAKLEEKTQPSRSSSVWSRWRGWFARPQQTKAQLLRVSKSSVLALKIAAAAVGDVDAVGLSIVDSLSNNVTLNLGFGVVHVAALKAFTWRE
ncbi:kinase-like domain-containing protein [Russula brevipes]|nr:kinase-like domain-containing protein [Russula brevipes]